MKKWFTPFIVLGALLALFATAVARSATPPITVPPNWDVPEQSQASALAVPNPEPVPKTVLSVIQCNNLIGLIVIDDTGEVHPYHYTSKEDAQSVQALVPADHNIAVNVGCPGNRSKDVTVL